MRRAESGRPARTRRLADKTAKPALPRSGATLPEAATCRSSIQHGYGTIRRADSTLHQLILEPAVSEQLLEAGSWPTSVSDGDLQYLGQGTHLFRGGAAIRAEPQLTPSYRTSLVANSRPRMLSGAKGRGH